MQHESIWIHSMTMLAESLTVSLLRFDGVAQAAVQRSRVKGKSSPLAHALGPTTRRSTKGICARAMHASCRTSMCVGAECAKSESEKHITIRSNSSLPFNVLCTWR